MPPPAELRKRPQDGVSLVQKVAAVEIGFRGAPRCFWGIYIYICIYIYIYIYIYSDHGIRIIF